VTPWLAILGMALVTMALRASFLLLPEGVPALSLANERLLAGLVAIAVAWRFRLTYLTLAAGMLALHLFSRLS